MRVCSNAELRQNMTDDIVSGQHCVEPIMVDFAPGDGGSGYLPPVVLSGGCIIRKGCREVHEHAAGRELRRVLFQQLAKTAKPGRSTTAAVSFQGHGSSTCPRVTSPAGMPILRMPPPFTSMSSTCLVSVRLWARRSHSSASVTKYGCLVNGMPFATIRIVCLVESLIEKVEICKFEIASPP